MHILTLYEIGKSGLSPSHIAGWQRRRHADRPFAAYSKAWNCNGLVSFSGPDQIESYDVSYQATDEHTKAAQPAQGPIAATHLVPRSVSMAIDYSDGCAVRPGSGPIGSFYPLWAIKEFPSNR